MKKKRILLIGDGLPISPQLKEVLSGSGHKLVTLLDESDQVVEEAMRLMPDLIVLHPGPSSYIEQQNLQEVLRKRCGLPVLFIRNRLRLSPPDMAGEDQCYPVVDHTEEIHQFKEHFSEALRLPAPPNQTAPLHLEYRRPRLPRVLFVRENRHLTRIRYEDILFVEAMKDYVNIYTEHSVHSAHISMKEMEELLPESDFVRIHRSYIVRLDAIGLLKYPAMLLNGKSQALPIGGYYRRNLYERMRII